MLLLLMYILYQGERMRVEILLKELRLKKNMSLRELEMKSGVSKTQLNSIELNEKEPTITTLVRIAKALDVDIKDLYKVEW
jgi:transcriptional regulator with XRE-family HTH domain